MSGGYVTGAQMGFAPMQVAAAMQAAADLFERKPDVYNFQITRIPRDEDSPGCILGHIARILGIYHVDHADSVAMLAFNMGANDFFQTIVASMPLRIPGSPNDRLQMAGAVTVGLRNWAQKISERQGIPQDVRKLFEPEPLDTLTA